MQILAKFCFECVCINIYFLPSTYLTCDIASIKMISIIIIFKFEKLKECCSRDNATYSEFIVSLWLYNLLFYCLVVILASIFLYGN